MQNLSPIPKLAHSRAISSIASGNFASESGSSLRSSPSHTYDSSTFEFSPIKENEPYVTESNASYVISNELSIMENMNRTPPAIPEKKHGMKHPVPNRLLIVEQSLTELQNELVSFINLNSSKFTVLNSSTATITPPAKSVSPTPALAINKQDKVHSKGKTINPEKALPKPHSTKTLTQNTKMQSKYGDLEISNKHLVYLEKLIDTLTKLMIDMMLDPVRVKETLKRLNDATRILEGF
ncbi:hypothetical protein TBLA_0F00940 [Henningerozyma blattae CBS 6284]|uniref:Uncharacterized protein n=1 Tax=Henningerozyma blattae (strain ATCC 34711 / CBS 6284 / DSM 70876 / NBRC 10599 / NRRL Y-10934 / UCD 77-7) TaxID=1071380 RepID=I2H5I6_HENB6|nr:hypothetical protein TBLA_0F00940 [Tetrapisispora blattae CBS 6284]CCH61638.1 hypothetical protein TBLA_0F00940 [Tetrapisispora blattae CBS 6284]